MATVTGYTAARMKQIEDAAIVDGRVESSNGHLILTSYDGTDIDAGNVVGPQGDTIASSEVAYGSSTSQTVEPSTWLTLPPAIDGGSYLWVRVTMTMSNYGPVVSKFPIRQPEKGDKGDPGDWYANDTGWVSITPTAPVLAYAVPPKVRRINNLVFLKGGFRNITVSTNPVIAQLPSSQFYPPAYTFVNAGSADDEKAINLEISTGGAIQLRTNKPAAYVMLTGIVYTID